MRVVLQDRDYLIFLSKEEILKITTREKKGLMQGHYAFMYAKIINQAGGETGEILYLTCSCHSHIVFNNQSARDRIYFRVQEIYECGKCDYRVITGPDSEGGDGAENGQVSSDCLHCGGKVKLVEKGPTVKIHPQRLMLILNDKPVGTRYDAENKIEFHKEFESRI